MDRRYVSCRVLRRSSCGQWGLEGPVLLDITTGCYSYSASTPCTAVLMPALYNPHTHVGDRQFRGRFALECLSEYLERTETCLAADPPQDRIVLCANHYAEMISTGVAGFFASNYEPGDLHHVAHVVSGYILSAIPRLHQFRRDVSTTFRAFVDQMRIRGDIRPGLFIHNIRDVSRHELALFASLAHETHALVAAHVCETAANTDDIVRLNDVGLLSTDPILVHCVHASGRDLDLIAAHGGTPCICMTSNLSIGEGLPPIRDMLERGLNPTLATDGPGTCPAQDLFREAALVALLYRETFKERLELILEMLFVNATCALQIPFRNPDDLPMTAMLVEISEEDSQSIARLIGNLVLGTNRGQVCALWVAGQLVYRRQN